jgi:microsomal dipeptidase-like Zn-dependent dipeptidase
MIEGYADLHCHPMAHLSFGGATNGYSFFWGNPTEPLPRALSSCATAHSARRGLWRFLTGRAGFLHPWVPWLVEQEWFQKGFESFASWPRPNTRIHQQMHIDGIYRTFHSGLKLLVASAVNNELLADAYHHGGAVDSSDDQNIEAQLEGIREMVKANSNWMAIVQTPEEARCTIENGKLAIVLGIEVDTIVGQGLPRDTELDPGTATKTVDYWWKKGIRLINPIHLADNALGGTAIYNNRFNCLNDYLTRKYARDSAEAFWDVEDAARRETTKDVRFLLTHKGDLLVRLYSLRYCLRYPRYIKQNGRVGHVNTRGLSTAGTEFIQAMMYRGMLIDVEHMSSLALEDTIEIAEKRRYPLVSSHTALRRFAVQRDLRKTDEPGCAHEAMRTDAELVRIRDLGGVLGLGGHAGIIKGVKHDTDRSWSKIYNYAVNTLKFKSVAIGTDMNGFAETPGPRFRKDGIAGTGLKRVDDKDVTRALRYLDDHPAEADEAPFLEKPIEKSCLGERKFDYNVDGLAHYGLLPDFVVDVGLSLKASGALAPLFSSAEALVTAWEKCVTVSKGYASPTVRDEDISRTGVGETTSNTALAGEARRSV